MGPIDYGSMVAQLDLRGFNNSLANIQQANAIERDDQRQQQAAQLAQQKFTQDQLRNQDYQAAIGDLTEGFTPEKLRDIAFRFPEHQEALEAGFKTYNNAAQQDIIRTGTGILGALSANNDTLALKLLDDRSGSLKAAGIDTTQTDAIRDAIKSNDPEQHERAIGMVGYIMSGAVGADHAAGLMETLGIGSRAERDERRLKLSEVEARERARHNLVTEGQGAARVGLSAAAGARAAAKANGRGKASGGGGSGGYEYRIGPDGKLQRRKR